MCFLTNERYRIYLMGYSFRHLGHAPGVGLGGTVGGGGGGGGGGGLGGSKKNFPKFNQIWRVRFLHQWHIQRQYFFGPHPLGPWGGGGGGAKRSNYIKGNFKDF